MNLSDQTDGRHCSVAWDQTDYFDGVASVVSQRGWCLSGNMTPLSSSGATLMHAHSQPQCTWDLTPVRKQQ